MFEISEQRLADQVKQIKHNQWLTKVEVEEMIRIISQTEAGDYAEEVQEEQVNVAAGELASFQNTDEVTGMGGQEGGGVEEGTEDASIDLTAEELEIRKWIEEVMVSVKGTGKWSIPAMRQVPRKRLTNVSAMVSRILGTVSTTNITKINDLVFAGVVVVAEKLGVKSSQSQHKDNKPSWKRRLEDLLRNDLSRIEQMDRGAMKDSDVRNRLMKKYQVKGKGMSVVKEEMKQRVKAKPANVKRYNDRVRQFHQNRLFNTNQRQLFKELDGKCDNSQVGPEPTEARTFWGSLWDQPGEHNRQAE